MNISTIRTDILNWVMLAATLEDQGKYHEAGVQAQKTTQRAINAHLAGYITHDEMNAFCNICDEIINECRTITETWSLYNESVREKV